MDDWIRTLLACRQQAQAAMLVTVASTRGSVPREPGSRMVVTAAGVHDSIGGGNLELQAIAIARSMLVDDADCLGALRRFPLGASLGQCCGGLVNLMFEPVAPSASQAAWLDEVDRCRARGEDCVRVSGAGSPAASGALVVTADDCSGSLGDARTDAVARELATRMLACRAATRLASLTSLTKGGPLFLFDALRAPDFDIVLFGAGHVGQALARILAGLPCRVTWVDERADRFSDSVADNFRIEVSDDPLAEVVAARPGSFFLVMTHSHPLDQALTEAILRRADFRYFGLIGSLTKRRQFERRLAARGIAADTLARMTCPIGIAGIGGKEPVAIAVAVAAQLLRVHGQAVIHEQAGEQGDGQAGGLRLPAVPHGLGQR